MIVEQKQKGLQGHSFDSRCHRRTLQNRRSFRFIYFISLSLFVLWLPLARLFSIGRPGRASKQRSIIGQARSEASIVASYALMGF